MIRLQSQWSLSRVGFDTTNKIEARHTYRSERDRVQELDFEKKKVLEISATLLFLNSLILYDGAALQENLPVSHDYMRTTVVICPHSIRRLIYGPLANAI